MDQVPGLIPQPRDIALLRTLLESRVMTTAQGAALHFDGKPEAAKKRLRKLKDAGLISERPRKPYEPAVLFLTRRALHILRDKGILAEYPSIGIPSLERRAQVSDYTIRHELEVMDVKAAFHSAITDSPKLKLIEFTTWPLLYQFDAQAPGGQEVTVKPDGFIRVQESLLTGGTRTHNFFLELDRSTESHDTLISRARCYFNYFLSGGFSVRNGSPPTAFKKQPFRVLYVFQTAARRNEFGSRLLGLVPPILTQAYLTTVEQLRTNPLGQIWVRPIDHRCDMSPNVRGRDPSPESHLFPFLGAKNPPLEQQVPKLALFT